MPIDLEKIKLRLLDEKTRLEADKARIAEHGSNAQNIGEVLDLDSNTPGDAGNELVEREKNEAFTENLADMLKQVDEALAKVDSGVYGKCDRCGKTIGAARLEVLPYALLCIDCQSRSEGL